jgi:thioredoxin reductase (NADPH)
MTDSYYFLAFYTIVLSIPLTLYLRRQKRKEKLAREAAAKGELYSEGPRGQHPHIDVTNCIGCQACTSACPEGDVLGMVGGKAAMLKPYKCIGHGMCAEACPVGAISMRTANASLSADLPFLTPENETTVPNLFIAGELGGLALIRNAVRQGRECIDVIAGRIAAGGGAVAASPDPEILDVAVIGAGPAGISAALRSIECRLNYLVIERDMIGGTVAKYPRQKLVMTSPIEWPVYGVVRDLKLSKERLLAFWKKIGERDDFRAQLHTIVEDIRRDAGGVFTVKTTQGYYRARAVILGIGRSGTPRKLGVKGEELPKVMYRLIEAEQYSYKKILVVGGGDSAVEAAIGLSLQVGNKVTLSYRKDSFHRIKERNAQKIAEQQRSGKVKVIFDSVPVEFTEKAVLLETGGKIEELPNDYVWIFAGGVAPNDFLKNIGVGFGAQDLTIEASREALLTNADPVGVAAVES